MRETPNFARQKFLYRVSRTAYEKEWGKDYVKPGFGTRVAAIFLRYIPKIGPLKGMAFKNPTAQTEDLYIKSIDATVDQYRGFLEAVRVDTRVLPNRDLDSGNLTKAAEYSLTDETYAKLLTQLSNRQSVRVSLCQEDEHILLVVEDDGVGFCESDLSNSLGSLGLLGMKERAQFCGGDVQISSSPGNGTTVTVRVPVDTPVPRGSKHAHPDSR